MAKTPAAYAEKEKTAARWVDRYTIKTYYQRTAVLKNQSRRSLHIGVLDKVPLRDPQL